MHSAVKKLPHGVPHATVTLCKCEHALGQLQPGRCCYGASPAALAQVAAQEQSPGWVLHTLGHLNEVLEDFITLGIATLDVQAANSNHQVPAGVDRWLHVGLAQNTAKV